MRSINALVLVAILLLSRPEMGRADVVSDAASLASQLNPINIALKGLIGEAAGALDSVLQRQLEHLQSVIQIAITQLNDAAKTRIDQIDERARAQIADLNRQVRDNLLVFSALVGKHLSTIDASLRRRIDQFNFGLANTLASIKWLPTVPLLMLDGNGITTFKQDGDKTSLFIGGSSFTKYGPKPQAFLSGSTIKSTSFFSSSNEIEVEVPNYSMGLIEVSIPNNVVPDRYGPQAFSLKLKIVDGYTLGVVTHYNEQSVRLNICGRLPRVRARLVVWASGRAWVKDRLPLKDLLHATAPGGNGNDHDTACLPNSPPAGWEFDRDPPDFGIVYGSENHNNYGRIVPPRADSTCITAYADGRDGNAHQNIQDIRIKVMRLEDRDECNPKWRSDVFTLPYGSLAQQDVHDRIRASSAGDCDAARARAIPIAHVRVEWPDNGNIVTDLTEGIDVPALDGSVSVKLNSNGLVEFTLSPQCIWRVRPAGQ
ncbi:MAG: hypothetical protein WBW33_09005 [Bryobacteraceae bacterium]